MSGYLLVVSDGRTFGLPAAGVDASVGIDGLLPAPVARPAVRGVLPVGDTLVSLAHLAAALDDGTPPAALGLFAVLLRADAGRLAVEVDVTADFVPQDPEPVPAAWDVPWAAGVARVAGRLVPVVDLDALIERVRAVRAGART